MSEPAFSVYGPLTTVDMVEDAVEQVVRDWIDTYLSRTERIRGLAPRYIRRPAGYRVDTDVRKLPEDQLPVIVVESPGEQDTPDVDGDGVVSGVLPVAVVAVVKSGEGRRATQRLARWYGAAIAELIEHQAGDLGGLGQIASRPSQSFDQLPRSQEQDRFLAAAYVAFLVEVGVLRNRYGGPEVPDDPAPTDPPAESPTDPEHLTTNVTVEVMP